MQKKIKMNLHQRFCIHLLLCIATCSCLDDGHVISKRLWRSWVGAEVEGIEKRGLRQFSYDDFESDDRVPELREIDEQSLRQDEMQVDVDSPEYRKMALQEDALQGDIYAERPLQNDNI